MSIGPRLVAAVLVVPVLASAPVEAGELADWFATPAQRAAARLEAGEHEILIDEAPNAWWEGLGRDGAGDAEGAVGAFSRALEGEGADTSAGSNGASGRPTGDERDALLYNLATAATRAGRPAEALPLFDEVLERNPTHEDALHNREIARRLVELDEEAQGGEGDPEEGSEGEGDETESGEGEGTDGDSASGERRDEPQASGDEASGDETSSAEAGERDAPEGGEGGGAGESDEGADERSAEEREAERRAAAEALAAERQAGDEPNERDGQAAAATDDTPTEREQATEQWLRRIADDPAGLLRRRLERSHRIDYPEVRDGEQPW